jgi:hypothetical protein
MLHPFEYILPEMPVVGVLPSINAFVCIVLLIWLI